MPCSVGSAWPEVVSMASGSRSAIRDCSAAGRNRSPANRIRATRIDFVNDIGLERCVSGTFVTPTEQLSSTCLAKARGKLPHRENFHKGFLRFNPVIALLNGNVERF